MSGDQMANLAYLGLLGAVIAFYFFIQNRQSLGKTAQQGLIWGFLFLGVIAAYGMWGDVRRTVMPVQSLSSDAARLSVPRSPDGHYYLTLNINDTPTRFMVDTGASMVVLTKSDATRAGISLSSLSFFNEAMTANGPVRTAPVTLTSIGPFGDTGFRAWVNEGEMEQSLLGMDYLQRFQSVQIQNGELHLIR